MIKLFTYTIFTALFIAQASALPEKSTVSAETSQADSLHQVAENLLLQQQQQHFFDSLIKVQLQEELDNVGENTRKAQELEEKLATITANDSIRKLQQLQKIEELKKNSIGYAVAPFYDTLFFVYTRIGSFSAKDRANAISQRIVKMYNDPYFIADSLKLIETENGFDIVYNNDNVIQSITNLDALWFGKENKELAETDLLLIKNAVVKHIRENSVNNWVKRIGLVLLIILGLGLIIFIINWLFARLTAYLDKNKSKYFKGLTIRKLNLLTAEKFRNFALQVINLLRIATIILAVYLSLPLLFSVFPETKKLTDTLLGWVLTPAKSALSGFIHYLPNLFTIAVIFLLFRYTIRAIKVVVDEIEKGTISIAGFHRDWAQPTFDIAKFLLYAFMVVIIFPYLPGSGSAAFQGVSVFIGVLLSFGSSSAISNLIAGLVITYMRPFKLGDRIKIGDVIGDAIEKTLLVTRIRTIKNEEITIPNAAVLSTNVVNFSTNTKPEDNGLILHTSVTIGYDVPWKDMHEALIKAALATEYILKTPEPFVLQTSLDDFYVSYQINAYTKEANKQATIYSALHQNIQDSCNQAGIEILSPHYRSMRDGNMVTIPANYLDKDYKAPTFNVKQVKETE